MWSKFSIFLDRPFGGIELEVALSSVELLWALVSAILSANGQALFSPPLALPWLLSSCATFAGLWLFARRNRWCAPLRLAGALSSVVIWGMVSIEAAQHLSERPVFAYLLPLGVVFVLSHFRIAISARRRWYLSTIRS